MAVDVRLDSKIEWGIPRPQFDTKLSVDPIRDQFAMTADGQRFLIQEPIAKGSPTPTTVVVNWATALAK
jgi:hypothetical protein